MFEHVLTNNFVRIVNTTHRTSCMTSVSSGEAPMRLWCCQQEIIRISCSIIAKSEPKPRHRHVLLLPRSSSLGMCERQSLFREGRILIFKPINLLRSSLIRHHVTRSAAKLRSRLSVRRRHVSCQLRQVLTSRRL